GDPGSSVLYDKITDGGVYGGHMPPEIADLLDPENITLVQTWITELASGLFPQQADFSYTLAIPNATLDENQGEIRIEIGSGDVSDIAGNPGPTDDKEFTFIYDNNPPGAVEVESITSPTNEDYPLIKVTAYDTISSGDNQVKVRAFIGEDTSPSNQIYLSEVSTPLAPFRQVLIDGDKDENTSLHIIYNVDEDDNPIHLTDGNLLDGLLYENLILVFEDNAGNDSILNVTNMTITPFRIDRTAPNPYGTGLDDYDGISYSLTHQLIGQVNDIYYNVDNITDGIDYNDYFWNLASGQVRVNVSDLPTADIDNSILGGTIHLMAKVDDENSSIVNYVNMAQSEVITADHLPPNPTDMFDFSISEEDLGGPDFAEGDSIIYIIAVITDLAGNVYDHITSPPDVISITIDTIPPAVGTINLETDINDENNSVAVPGYWNIDTDKVTVPLGDLSDDIDTYIEHGKVQLRGSINSGDWEFLASHQLITDENITDFSIVVTDSGGLNGPDNTTGIEEIPDNWDAAVDGAIIEIIARIYDAAGNYRDWP
ncbi:uncharacterized protein METZ01_LOCUS209327, partial [marine metagenome]